MEDEILDLTKLKYVLYARKSTDDPQRQLRTIEDQIAECLIHADRLHLNVVNRKNPIIEKRSAKKPGQRPQFKQVLSDIRSGKYDGILAWNPDRLARNMKEGGEIIDMVDEGVIKDLQFVTHHFTSDANGKMLLGMAFVLSKQYSDKLSQDVTRGVRRRFGEGQTQIPKHGYLNEKGLYKPDGKNFELVCTAWNMRSEGVSIGEIVDFMNENGYARIIKRSGKLVKMTIQILSNLFKDPFYYGILIQAKQKVDLQQMYDFEPAITEDIYNKVQQLSYRRIKPNKPHNSAFYPLKTMVVCSFCSNNMYIGPSSGTTRRYLNARCDNKSCRRKKKSIRMIHVFDFIYKFLEEGLNFTEKEYSDYYNNLTNLTDKKRVGLSVMIHSKQGVLKRIVSDIKDISLGIIKLSVGSPAFKINEDKITELNDQKIELEGKIEELKTQISNPEDDRLTIEQFLNLSKNAATIVKSANAIVKDQICRIIFLNLIVNEEKVLSYQLKEPFATLMNRPHISSGGQRIKNGW